MPHARNSRELFDVLVAGAGPAGLTLALALAQRDFTCTVVDARPPEAEAGQGRYYFIAHGCWRIFTALGLGAVLEGSAEPVLKVEAAGAGGGIAFLAGEAREDGPLGYMISAAALSAALLEAASRQKGLSIQAPVRVDDLEFGEGLVTARTDTGDLRARLIVGCDGARSAVRTLAGIRYEGWDYPQKALSTVVKLAVPHDGAARQIFLRYGPVALLPLPDDHANLVWTERAAVADVLARMSDEDFTAELQKQAPGFVSEFSLAAPRAAFAVGLHVADRFHGPRVALAGDAAHQVHPLAGQGLNLGLKDVAALVDVITEAARVGLDIGAETALAPYTRWRRADVVATAAAMEGFTRTFAAPAPLRAMAGLGMQIAGQLKPLRGLFAREAGGVLGDLPSLMRAS
jgi:2-octaprenyl-6-methoxyphenol hydroxylase